VHHQLQQQRVAGLGGRVLQARAADDGRDFVCGAVQVGGQRAAPGVERLPHGWIGREANQQIDPGPQEVGGDQRCRQPGQGRAQGGAVVGQRVQRQVSAASGEQNQYRQGTRQRGECAGPRAEQGRQHGDGRRQHRQEGRRPPPVAQPVNQPGHQQDRADRPQQRPARQVERRVHVALGEDRRQTVDDRYRQLLRGCGGAQRSDAADLRQAQRRDQIGDDDDDR